MDNCHPFLRIYSEVLSTKRYSNAYQIFLEVKKRGFNVSELDGLGIILLSSMKPEEGLKFLTDRLNNQANIARAKHPNYFSIPTNGSSVHIPKCIESDVISILRRTCSFHFRQGGIRPIKLTEAGISENINDLIETLNIKNCLSLVNKYINPSYQGKLSLLMSRCLLRRTYPIANSAHSNVNNISWHQDSNNTFNDRPLLTVWIPLQDGAGVVRPGLSTLKYDFSSFHSVYGDGCNDVNKIVTIDKAIVDNHKIDSGDAIVINGLTFHQTYTTSTMKYHRDALLLRITNNEHSEFFPEGEAFSLDI